MLNRFDRDRVDMLGDLIYEGKGKVSGERILELDPPKIETSYTMESKLKGMKVSEVGTYTSTMRSDGTMLGEDKAIIMADDGSGTTGTAQGIGRIIGPEKISFRGFATLGPSGSGILASVNSLLIAIEVQVDGEDLTIRGWEWK